MKPIYLDYNASTPIDSRVYEAMVPYFTTQFGNPSSSHSYGKVTKEAVDLARRQICDCIGGDPKNIIFMGTGTETINYVIRGVHQLYNDEKIHMITSQVEHVAVKECCKYLADRGVETTYLSVDNEGILKLDELKSSLARNTKLVTIMLANNEIGTLQPLLDIVKIVRKYEADNNTKIFIHTDASQAIGKMKFNVDVFDVDFVTIAGHKIYAPKGIGALYGRCDLPKLIHGASHEYGRRAGTENVPYIVGLGKAMEILKDTLDEELNSLNDKRELMISLLKEKCKVPFIINGPADRQKRVPHLLSISFKELNGSTIADNLSEKVCISTSSACHSGCNTVSYILKSINVPDEYIHGTLRISVGRYTTIEEINIATDIIADTVNNYNKSK